jgi:hypothetical protein
MKNKKCFTIVQDPEPTGKFDIFFGFISLILVLSFILALFGKFPLWGSQAQLKKLETKIESIERQLEKLPKVQKLEKVE